MRLSLTKWMAKTAGSIPRMSLLVILIFSTGLRSRLRSRFREADQESRVSRTSPKGTPGPVIADVRSLVDHMLWLWSEGSQALLEMVWCLVSGA